MTDGHVTFWRRITNLKAELEELRRDYDSSELDRRLVRQELEHTYEMLQTGRYLSNRPPTPLMHALRSAGTGRFAGAWVPVLDSRRLYLLLEGEATGPDLDAEVDIWEWVQANLDSPPPHPFGRRKLPRYLHGVAWENGALLISQSLSGSDAATARRGLHQAVRHPVERGLRSLSILLLPGVLGMRLLRHSLLSAGVAAPTATVTAAALPLMTAAAISTGLPAQSTIDLDDSGRPGSVRFQPVDLPAPYAPPGTFPKKPSAPYSSPAEPLVPRRPSSEPAADAPRPASRRPSASPQSEEAPGTPAVPAPVPPVLTSPPPPLPLSPPKLPALPPIPRVQLPLPLPSAPTPPTEEPAPPVAPGTPQPPAQEVTPVPAPQPVEEGPAAEAPETPAEPAAPTDTPPVPAAPPLPQAPSDTPAAPGPVPSPSGGLPEPGLPEQPAPEP